MAGKRAGLAGERSGLFMEQIRLIKELRENDRQSRELEGSNDDIRPRYMVWENVQGAFSSNKGEDFRAVLEETARVKDKNAVIPGLAKGQKWTPAGAIMGDGWSIAWRLHDAQFWGVPQRRKRIALVADFGGDTAPEILFERESLSGDFASCGEKGQDAAGATGQSVEGASRSDIISDWLQAVNSGAKHQQDLIQDDRGIARTLAPGTHAAGSHLTKTLITNTDVEAYTLKMRGGVDVDSKGKKAGKGPLIQTELSGMLGVSQDQTLFCVDQGAGKSQCGVDENLAPTLATTHGGEPVVYGICSDGSNSMRSDNPYSGIYEADTTRTLDNNGGNPACNQGGMAVVQGADMYNGSLTGDIAATLNASSGDSPTHSGPSVVCLEGNGSRPSHQGNGYAESDTMYTLNSTEQHAVCVEDGKKRTVYDWHRQDTRMTELGDVCVTAAAGWGGGGNNMPYVLEEVAGTLDASYYKGCGERSGVERTFVAQNWDGSQISPTLTQNNAGGGQRMPDKDNFNAVIAFTTEQTPKTDEENRAFSLRSRDYKDPQSITYQKTTGDLMASGYDKLGTQEAANDMFVVSGVDAYNQQITGDKAKALNSIATDSDHVPCVTYGLDRAAYNQGENAQYDFAVDEEKIGTQVAKGPGAVCQSVVRRLTPLECERLQGYPDHWTDIGDWVDSKGKKRKDADSPRYKALGNSIALPFWQWMAERMVAYLGEEPTMASLFDGISGFCLVFARAGVKPVFSSEIEEFPIAVAKKHFGDDEKGVKGDYEKYL